MHPIFLFVSLFGVRGICGSGVVDMLLLVRLADGRLWSHCCATAIYRPYYLCVPSPLHPRLLKRVQRNGTFHHHRGRRMLRITHTWTSPDVTWSRKGLESHGEAGLSTGSVPDARP
ncbi:hypothetical protein BJ508DRAFT_66671 [Ascobolus immersus RN42]|uniref:Uncharacterized protein n=1 Tax=Ascobolus immersus RN42 TaxID=1160509 RepID=A0A3N4ID78_ASCIM|nr:hypothetical protein BJ508DRAFT_66671 [Ascobolus immersus RN42]